MKSDPLNHPVFSEIDRHFARLIGRMSKPVSPEAVLAAALVSCHRRQGHICVDLERIAGRGFPAKPELDDEVAPIALPELDILLSALKACSSVGKPGQFTPLVLDSHNRLYLHRYWEYEWNLALAILRRAQEAAEGVNEELLREGLDRFFPARTTTGEPDFQRVAADTAVKRKLCVISGGPGTGKTRTVGVLLALLLEQAGEKSLRIALAAPTGKAAARLQESIKKLRETLPCAGEIRARLPEEAFTVHRLLGSAPDSSRVRYDAENLLPFDVVVVDEASMVDLALMAKLFAAIPPSSRVILLGDKDQLASVEAGAVLGDICGGAKEHSQALASCIVELQTNFRFGADNGILALSQAINAGDTAQVEDLLSGVTGKRDGLGGAVLPVPSRLKEQLREIVLLGFGETMRLRDPQAALDALSRFRFLCAVRQGPYGVEAVNRLVEEILLQAGRIPTHERWYSGRPVMVTRNDYDLRLFNGDVGIILPDPVSGETRAWFLGADNALRSVSPLRLPEHETVFAMTVHKSQGSEFERVLFILPDRESAVLTRELIYTGVTRASRRVEVWFASAILRAALARTVERASGLREAIRGQIEVLEG